MVGLLLLLTIADVLLLLVDSFVGFVVVQVPARRPRPPSAPSPTSA
jgi:hypothetical protein